LDYYIEKGTLMITPKTIMEDAWCYMKSRVLFTAAELDVFTKLADCHYTAAELARDGNLDERGTTRLLDSLVGLGMLHKEQQRYRLVAGSEVLSAKHPATILPMAKLSGQLVAMTSKLVSTGSLTS
jgi:Dimerisation domain